MLVTTNGYCQLCENEAREAEAHLHGLLTVVDSIERKRGRHLYIDFFRRKVVMLVLSYWDLSSTLYLHFAGFLPSCGHQLLHMRGFRLESTDNQLIHTLSYHPVQKLATR